MFKLTIWFELNSQNNNLEFLCESKELIFIGNLAYVSFFVFVMKSIMIITKIIATSPMCTKKRWSSTNIHVMCIFGFWLFILSMKESACNWEIQHHTWHIHQCIVEVHPFFIYYVTTFCILYYYFEFTHTCMYFCVCITIHLICIPLLV